MPQLDFDGANSLIKADKIQGQSGSTVTVPTSHVLAIADSAGLTLGGTAVNAGSLGKVLQVVGTVSNSSQVYVNTLDTSDVLYSLSITPSSTSSKILVHVDIVMEKGAGTGYCDLNIYRGVTSLYRFTNAFGHALTSGVRGHLPGTFLDSPNSSSSVTYNIKPSSVTSGGATTFYRYDSSLTLIEVGV